MERRALVALAVSFLLPPTLDAQIPKDFAVPSVSFDATFYPKGFEPSSMRVADFDEDGTPDVAVSTWYSNPRSTCRGDAGRSTRTEGCLVLAIGCPFREPG